MMGTRLRALRKGRGMTQRELSSRLGLTPKMVSFYELGERTPPNDVLRRLSEIFSVSTDYLLGVTDRPALALGEEVGDVRLFDVIGSISAGYDSLAVETATGETEAIPLAFLSGGRADDFFVLRVKGHSMYPKILDGDRVLVRRCRSVDSGSVAVVLYNDIEATIKTVRYVAGEDWVELLPANPEYQAKRIEGEDLAHCLVLGKVIKLIRDL